MRKSIILLLLFVPLLASASFDVNLNYGLKNNRNVKELQKFLIEQKVYKGSVTGNFLGITQKAVKDFQKKENIRPVSGFFGPATRKRANAMLMEKAEQSVESAVKVIEQKETAATDAFLLQQQIEILNAKIRNLASIAKSAESAANKEDISAGGYIVMDAENKEVLSEKNAEQAYPIASVTKLINAAVVLENISKNVKIKLTKAMLRPDGGSPSLFLNSKISVKDLLSASLIQSVNDAAEALSHGVGRGRFVNLMNKKAKALGMEDTEYYDAHGLNPNNVSTAKDLAKLGAYIYQKHPEILAITRNDDFWLPDAEGKLLKFKNLNHFYVMPQFIGGKTGHLAEAKETMVSLFDINGKPFVIVVLHSEDAQADTLKLVELAKNSHSQTL